MANFSFIASFVTTAPPFISEPVAASVMMSKIISASFGHLPVKKSQTSPLYLTPAATTLAVSSTEPPPMASTLSTPCFLAKFIASFTLLSTGFDFTPPILQNSMPFALRLFVATSKSPFCMILSLP